MSEGLILGYQTTEDTVPITVNKILTRDSDGDVVATTIASADTPIVGVSSGAVAARTTGSKKDIPVKVQGLAYVPKTSSAMKIGFIVSTGGTTTVGTGDGSTVIMATTATTLGGAYKDLGRVAKDAAASDTEVLIALNIR